MKTLTAYRCVACDAATLAYRRRVAPACGRCGLALTNELPIHVFKPTADDFPKKLAEDPNQLRLPFAAGATSPASGTMPPVIETGRQVRPDDGGLF